MRTQHGQWQAWEHPHLKPGPSAREAGGIGWGQVCWRDLLLVGAGRTHQSQWGPWSRYLLKWTQALLPARPAGFTLYRWSPALPLPPHLLSHSTPGLLPPSLPSSVLPISF